MQASATSTVVAQGFSPAQQAGAGAVVPDAEASRRAAERLRALREESDALLARERTLLVDLRRLEVARALKTEELRSLAAEAAQLEQDIADTTRHLAALERTRATQAPALRARLVELYKLGSGGYVRLLLGAESARELGSAYRTVTALAALDRERARAHHSTLAALQEARKSLEARRDRIAALRAEAATARAAISRALEEQRALVASIDARRDLYAQLMGELQIARQQLQRTVADLPARGSTVLPLRPFQGALEWPVAGRIRTPAGAQTAGVRIAADAGSRVGVIHEGTVAYAAPFTGFGNLVIVEHGRNTHSLYGYLERIDVQKNARLARGQTIGTVGLDPTGRRAELYFELRIDGRPVDPLQWLKSRP
jgi:septal ring factor EnvC (AmiA/AmiB activator)